MTIQQIKSALKNGESVYWSHKGYRVFLSEHGELLVMFEQNQYLSPLTKSDLISCFSE